MDITDIIIAKSLAGGGGGSGGSNIAFVNFTLSDFDEGTLKYNTVICDKTVDEIGALLTSGKYIIGTALLDPDSDPYYEQYTLTSGYYESSEDYQLIFKWQDIVITELDIQFNTREINSTSGVEGWEYSANDASIVLE